MGLAVSYPESFEGSDLVRAFRPQLLGPQGIVLDVRRLCCSLCPVRTSPAESHSDPRSGLLRAGRRPSPQAAALLSRPDSSVFGRRLQADPPQCRERGARSVLGVIHTQPSAIRVLGLITYSGQ